jgi:hypothetical protein
MSDFMGDYDERELAVIADYVTKTIAVLKEQTARLSAEGGPPPRGVTASET